MPTIPGTPSTSRLLYIVPIPAGMREIMEANRMMEIPLPIPNSVICSPSHMMNAEPATKVTMITNAAAMLSLVRMLYWLRISI